jgi:hypothetical protein
VWPFNSLFRPAQPILPASKAMNLDDATARLSVLAGKPARAFATRDFGREHNAAARSVVVRKNVAPELVERMRREIGPGLLAFIGCTRSLADPPDTGSEVVVALGDNQFDILRVAQSDAVNYDLETEDLVRKLQEYDSKFGIDIFHAETDTIEFKFRSVPDDLPAFCRDVYDFCPDIVDQGVGTVEKLEGEIARTGVVFLWWD